MGRSQRLFNIGTSGWSYDHWKGPFYPVGIRNEEMLEYYSRQFKSVEINSSFYHIPSRDSLKHWYENTPTGFTFAVKASRYITHMKKLNEPVKSVQALFERIGILEDKLGPILFQLPPKWRYNHERLARFLDSLSSDYRYAFEFRDQSWINPESHALLKRHNAAFCIYELGGYESPHGITADFVYLRLHGPKGPYQGSYDNSALAGWADTLSHWSAQRRKVYCYFDNDEAGYAAMNAKTLESMLPKEK